MTLPDTDDLSALGGVMIDYHRVEDPTCDMGAEFDNKVRTNVAAMTQTIDRVYMQFTSAASNPITVVRHHANWGNVPAVAPTVSRVSAGRYTVTWPATVTDELGVTHTVNLVGGRGNAQAGVFYQVQFLANGANSADVYILNAAGTLVDAAGINIDVWGR